MREVGGETFAACGGGGIVQMLACSTKSLKCLNG